MSFNLGEFSGVTSFIISSSILGGTYLSVVGHLEFMFSFSIHMFFFLFCFTGDFLNYILTISIELFCFCFHILISKNSFLFFCVSFVWLLALVVDKISSSTFARTLTKEIFF